MRLSRWTPADTRSSSEALHVVSDWITPLNVAWEGVVNKQAT